MYICSIKHHIMGDYLDKVTAADINDDEIIIEEETTCRTIVFRKAETQESKPYWITVDGQTGIEEAMNIGHVRKSIKIVL